MSIPGPKRIPSPGGETCKACQQPLTLNEVEHGLRTCKPCRRAQPVRIPAPARLPDRKKDSPRTYRSWWIDAPQVGFTHVAQGEVPRMRAMGVTYFSQAVEPEGRRLNKRLHVGVL